MFMIQVLFTKDVFTVLYVYSMSMNDRNVLFFYLLKYPPRQTQTISVDYCHKNVLKRDYCELREIAYRLGLHQ